MKYGNFASKLALLVISACIPACDAPSTTKPLGMVWDEQAMQSLEGIWAQQANGFIVANVGNDGKLHLATIEFERKSTQYELISFEASVTRLRGRNFVFVSFDGGTNYFFALLTKLEEREIRFRRPNPEVFVEAIRRDSNLGEIKRRPDSEIVRANVKGEDQVLLTIIEQYGVDKCFPKANETVLRRVNFEM